MRQRYTVHDIPALMELLGIDDYEQLVTQSKAWVDQTLAAGLGDVERDPRWAISIAVGSYDYVESVQFALGHGHGVKGRSIVEFGGNCVLCEAVPGYDAILP